MAILDRASGTLITSAHDRRVRLTVAALNNSLSLMLFCGSLDFDLVRRSRMTQLTTYDHIVFTEFDGTEGILVDLNTKKYYQLNETATLIWKGIANKAPIVEIANSLTSNYEVTPEDAERNVQAIVQQLQDYRLISAD